MPKFFSVTSADQDDIPRWFRTREAAVRWLKAHGAVKQPDGSWKSRMSWTSEHTGYTSVMVTRWSITEDSPFEEDR